MRALLKISNLPKRILLCWFYDKQIINIIFHLKIRVLMNNILKGSIHTPVKKSLYKFKNITSGKANEWFKWKMFLIAHGIAEVNFFSHS